MWMARSSTFRQRALQGATVTSLLHYTLPEQCLKRACLHTTSSTALFTGKNETQVRSRNCGLFYSNRSSLDFSMQFHRSSVNPIRTSAIRNSSTETKDSSKGELVYKGGLSGMIKGVKIFSLSTSALGLCLQPYLYLSSEELPLALKFVMGGIVNFFIFINPFIIHYIAKKYVTDIHWNRETGVFTASKLSFFLRRKEIQFTAADVTVPDIPGMFTVLEVKGTPLFLVPQDYLVRDAYVHLMGYDKPLEWELPKSEERQQSQN
ncbi:hypothetical protein BaRGS_00004030 [Batillaria attramentaria]|uniref:DUF304 domain-containing protein n=1 Tax=Batillaria attramentaria TaxID=370345 RepID=A0ABD0LXY9_9CAEN